MWVQGRNRTYDLRNAGRMASHYHNIIYRHGCVKRHFCILWYIALQHLKLYATWLICPWRGTTGRPRFLSNKAILWNDNKNTTLVLKCKLLLVFQIIMKYSVKALNSFRAQMFGRVKVDPFQITDCEQIRLHSFMHGDLVLSCSYHDKRVSRIEIVQIAASVSRWNGPSIQSPPCHLPQQWLYLNLTLYA